MKKHGVGFAGTKTTRRLFHACCHIPETTRLARASAESKPELWENAAAPREQCREHAFEFDTAPTRFGRGVLAETGATAAAMGLRRVAVVTDEAVAKMPFFESALRGLREAKVDAVVYASSMVEPTDESFLEAARWAQDVQPDGWVSIGGGSSIDTAKAANLFSTYPPPAGFDDFLHYVNAPVGRATPVPGPLKPHIACPTTAGTGSEGTGYAICDIASLGVKTALAHRALKPSMALIDPLTTHHLPASVLAASGLDVIMHAAESFTARPFYHRALAPLGTPRPLNQGQNPWSDIGCRETLRISGRYFARALADESDIEAREAMHWAATLAGTALNNAGTALPHGCSYPVSGGVKKDARHSYTPATGYASTRGGCSSGSCSGSGAKKAPSLLPHGYAVAVMAPAAFATTAEGTPERHLEAAALLGSGVAAKSATTGSSYGRFFAPDECGALLAGQIAELIKGTGDCPMGLGELGFTEDDIPSMVQGTIVQQRVLSIVPVAVDEEVLSETFRRAIAGYR